MNFSQGECIPISAWLCPKGKYVFKSSACWVTVRQWLRYVCMCHVWGVCRYVWQVWINDYMQRWGTGEGRGGGTEEQAWAYTAQGEDHLLVGNWHLPTNDFLSVVGKLNETVSLQDFVPNHILYLTLSWTEDRVPPAGAAKSVQPLPISAEFLFQYVQLCNTMDCSIPGCPVHHQFWGLLKRMSIKSVKPSKHLILSCPLPLLSVFPCIRVFFNESEN